MLLLLLFQSAMANKQPDIPNLLSTGTITGTIQNKDNQPLIGANVFILNSTLGTTTDNSGQFIITNVPTGPTELVVTYIGYQSRQRSIIIRKDQTITADFRLQTDILESSTIVVTGTATEYLYKDAPVKTEVVHRQLIERTQSCNLAEALSLQTGVRVENNCQNCNFTQVRILGFDGKYSQILIDGNPVVSSLAGVYALEQFPDEMIEQIEIVKGGGSALYGGGAMAGTINLRTRHPLINRSSFNYDTQSLDGSLDQRLSVMAEIISDNGKTGAYVFGASRTRHYYDHNNDGYSELGELDHKSLGANWYYRPLATGELQASFHRISEDRRGGNDFNVTPHEADIAEALEHERWGGKLRWNHRINNKLVYQSFYSFSLLDRESYYGGLGGNTAADSLEALNYYGTTDNETHIAGLQLTYTLGRNNITAGMQYSSDHLEDNSVNDPDYYINSTYTNTGLYIQDDLSLYQNRIGLVAGARIDNHSELDKAIVSPRFNIKYELFHDLYFRAAFTTGFKAPETFDEDLHIESLGGDQRVVRNADNLKPETSQTFTAGLEYQGYMGKYATLIGITGFYSHLENAFATVENNSTDSELILWERINSSGAQIGGFEIDLGLRPINELEFRAGFTYKTGNYEEPEEIFDGVFSDKVLRTPDLYGYFRSSYTYNNKLNFFGSAKYTGTMFVPNETSSEIVETSQTFYEIDGGLTYTLPTGGNFVTELSLGMKNILNAYQDDLQSGSERDPAYLYGPQLPRRLYLGLNFSF